MPLFQLDIQKQDLQGETEFWTNVYHLQLDGYDDLGPPAAIVAAERAIHSGYVAFVSFRLKQALTPFGYSRIVALAGPGEYVVGSTQLLPLYSTMRVDMGVSIGLPIRKYLRTGVSEFESDGRNWKSDYIATVASQYANVVSHLPEIRNPAGDAITGYAVKVPVQMRQLRRGSKRRLNPIIPTA